MPIIDGDKITVVRCKTVGKDGLSVEVDWHDGQTGENKGRYSYEWKTASEVKAFLEQTTLLDAVRGIVLAALDRTTNTLDVKVLDAAVGKEAVVTQKVTASAEAVKP